MKRLLVVALVACGGSSPKHADDKHGEESHGEHGMAHRFEHAEEWAKVFDDPARDAWQQPEKVIAALELSPSMVVADVGAGTGYFAVKIAKRVREVIAIDVEPDMTRYIGERAVRESITNITPRTAPKDDPKLATASCDRILIVDTWHHIDNRTAYTAKLADALKPDGTLAIVDFKLDAVHGPPKKHRLTPEAVIAELAAGGIEAKVVLDLPEQYVVYGRKK